MVPGRPLLRDSLLFSSLSLLLICTFSCEIEVKLAKFAVGFLLRSDQISVCESMYMIIDVYLL